MKIRELRTYNLKTGRLLMSLRKSGQQCIDKKKKKEELIVKITINFNLLLSDTVSGRDRQ